MDYTLWKVRDQAPRGHRLFFAAQGTLFITVPNEWGVIVHLAYKGTKEIGVSKAVQIKQTNLTGRNYETRSAPDRLGSRTIITKEGRKMSRYWNRIVIEERPVSQMSKLMQTMVADMLSQNPSRTFDLCVIESAVAFLTPQRLLGLVTTEELEASIEELELVRDANNGVVFVQGEFSNYKKFETLEDAIMWFVKGDGFKIDGRREDVAEMAGVGVKDVQTILGPRCPFVNREFTQKDFEIWDQYDADQLIWAKQQVSQIVIDFLRQCSDDAYYWRVGDVIYYDDPKYGNVYTVNDLDYNSEYGLHCKSDNLRHHEAVSD